MSSFFDDEFELEEGVDDDFFPHPLLAQFVRSFRVVRAPWRDTKVRTGAASTALSAAPPPSQSRGMDMGGSLVGHGTVLSQGGSITAAEALREMREKWAAVGFSAHGSRRVCEQEGQGCADECEFHRTFDIFLCAIEAELKAKDDRIAELEAALISRAIPWGKP